MQNYHDIVLFKTHQHVFVLISRFIKVFFPVACVFILGAIFFEKKYIFLMFFLLLVSGIVIFAYFYFFWSKSYFIITNEKIVVKVRTGFFSKFHMNIYFKNIRDMAFAKNNIFHYLLGFGTIFARSSAGAV